MTALDIGTPHGPARAHLSDGGSRGTLLLGHGAGGGVESADLQAVARDAAEGGWRVLLVEQPWRVAGRRIAPAPARLDEGWRAVVAHLAGAGHLAGPLVVGGRSAGARVACRTAAQVGADGVLTLAFPLHPPGRPEKSRAAELTGVTLPVVAVQGETDAFGTPAQVAAVLAGRANASVYAVPGDHALKKNPDLVGAAAAAWLTEVLPA
ncbi:alpha/beta family hydrolase [Blastococcus sp. SYSU DS0510]